MSNSIKVTIVEGSMTINNEKQNVYAVQLENGDILHEQRTDQISYSKYYKLIKKNHPEYLITNEEPAEEPVVIMTPPVEQSEHPEKEYMSKAFDLSDAVDDIPSKDKEPFVAVNVDTETGEIKEEVPQQNQNTMNTQEKEAPKVEATNVEQSVKKVSIAKKAKWYGAVGLGLGVKTVTTPTHFALQSASDILHLAAVGVRNLEASAINGLRISSASKEDIKASIDLRTRKIQSVAIMPITIPVGIVKTIKDSVKESKLNPQVQTA